MSERGTDRRVQGVVLRLVATALFAAMSLLVRWSSDLPLGQIVFFRSAVALVPIAVYLGFRGGLGPSLATRRPWGHVLRSSTGCLAMFLSFYALSVLPLSYATVLGFVGPILTVAVAPWVLGERLSPRILVPLTLGVAGVLVLLGPSLETAGQAALGGVLASLGVAVCNTASHAQIKRLTATEPAGTIAFYFALSCAAVGLATWPLGWELPDPAGWAGLVGAGVLGGMAHIAMTEAFVRAPASVLAPLEYTSLVWATLFDLVFWSLVPSPLGWLGMGLLTLGALSTLLGRRS